MDSKLHKIMDFIVCAFNAIERMVFKIVLKLKLLNIAQKNESNY
jgi:hypothetical protein